MEGAYVIVILLLGPQQVLFYRILGAKHMFCVCRKFMAMKKKYCLSLGFGYLAGNFGLLWCAGMMVLLTMELGEW